MRKITEDIKRPQKDLRSTDRQRWRSFCLWLFKWLKILSPLKCTSLPQVASPLWLPRNSINIIYWGRYLKIKIFVNFCKKIDWFLIFHLTNFNKDFCKVLLRFYMFFYSKHLKITFSHVIMFMWTLKQMVIS